MTLSDKEIIKLVKKEVYINKSPNQAEELLLGCKNKEHIDYVELFAYSEFLKKDYINAAELYSKIGKIYHQGYCLLMSGDINTAKKLWGNLDENAAVVWGQCLLGYIELNTTKVPSYMQIRNFLEKDLGNLLKSNQVKFAENLIDCSNSIVVINPESYKIIARTLFNHGFFEKSLVYFAKSLEITDQDPEIYFYLAKYCISKKIIPKAKRMLHLALDINEQYFAAKKLLDEIA